jgi:hypothetical protein
MLRIPRCPDSRLTDGGKVVVADREYCVVSATDPYGCILGFLDRTDWFVDFIKLSEMVFNVNTPSISNKII